MDDAEFGNVTGKSREIGIEHSPLFAEQAPDTPVDGNLVGTRYLVLCNQLLKPVCGGTGDDVIGEWHR